MFDGRERIRLFPGKMTSNVSSSAHVKDMLIECISKDVKEVILSYNLFTRERLHKPDISAMPFSPTIVYKTDREGRWGTDKIHPVRLNGVWIVSSHSLWLKGRDTFYLYMTLNYFCTREVVCK